MLPFTESQFFGLFAAYNGAIWPAQPVALVLGVLAFAAALRGGARSGRVVAAVLAAMWIWTGAAYHLDHFTAINPAAWLFGAAFLLQGGGFLAVAVSGRGLAFQRARGGARRAFGLALVAYAGVLYPLLGRLAGQGWAEIPAFGVTPCPVVLFTFGLLLLAVPPVAWWLPAIPALWATVGGSAAVLLAVPQDWMLLAGGLAAGAVLAFGSRAPFGLRPAPPPCQTQDSKEG